MGETGYINGIPYGGIIGSQNDIPKFELVSPKFAIQAALDDLSMGHLLQNQEDSLLRWCGEAHQEITADTKAETIYEPDEECVYTKHNRVKLCKGFKALDCVTINGCRISFNFSPQRCTRNCATNCAPGCYEQRFYLQGNWMHFTPPVPDGQAVNIQAWRTPKDEEGYVMVFEVCLTAIQRYVCWRVCHREGDRREGKYEQLWYNDCLKARSRINKKSDAELAVMGKLWNPGGWPRDRGYWNLWGNTYGAR